MYTCVISHMQAAQEMKEKLNNMLKDKSDRFDTMFEEETGKIRLDEQGWKQRWV